MEARELAVFQGYRIVVVDQPHEHCSDESGEELGFAVYIICWEDLAVLS